MTRPKPPPEPTARPHELGEEMTDHYQHAFNGGVRVQPAPSLEELDEICQACLEATGGVCRAHQEPERSRTR